MSIEVLAQVVVFYNNHSMMIVLFYEKFITECDNYGMIATTNTLSKWSAKIGSTWDVYMTLVMML